MLSKNTCTDTVLDTHWRSQTLNEVKMVGIGSGLEHRRLQSWLEEFSGSLVFKASRPTQCGRVVGVAVSCMNGEQYCQACYEFIISGVLTA